MLWRRQVPKKKNLSYKSFDFMFGGKKLIKKKKKANEDQMKVFKVRQK